MIATETRGAAAAVAAVSTGCGDERTLHFASCFLSCAASARFLSWLRPRAHAAGFPPFFFFSCVTPFLFRPVPSLPERTSSWWDWFVFTSAVNDSNVRLCVLFSLPPAPQGEGGGAGGGAISPPERLAVTPVSNSSNGRRAAPCKSPSDKKGSRRPAGFLMQY